METRSMPTDTALGPLNEYEKKYAPERLFLAGDASLLREFPKLAVVGSRQVSSEALDYARTLSRELAQAGAVVVSGLARGIDTVAHRAAMDADGQTIAVIGTPLERAYPPENAELQDHIARDHLVVSQFAPGEKTHRGSFPMRNRLMALISEASVIVAGGEKSGTEHQGWEALRLNRPLFLAPPLFAHGAPEWVDKLQEYGAVQLDGVEDILESVPFHSPQSVAAL